MYDLAVIGGGINGVGLARDASGRGLSVVLLEQNDLASGTSSASTKLIHGGLRYLEHGAFRLVRESLIERERLLQIAPHIIWPMRFVLPHAAGMRPAMLVRLGLFFYDHLGGRKILPPTRMLDLTRDEVGQPLRSGLSTAFEYSDCWVDDARLVVLNARDAAKRGASIRTRMHVRNAQRITGQTPHWQITTRDARTGEDDTIRARLLINAAGPWAGQVMQDVIGLNTPARIRMVKGSHLIVPRLFAHDRAYLFQNKDGRVLFAIPYEGDFTLLGTTDEDYTGDPSKAVISEAETRYICEATSRWFQHPVRAEHVIRSYSGIRPLYDDGASAAQEATRDYVLALNAPTDAAPLLSVFGGKLTTYRRLAEHAMEKLAPHLPDTAMLQHGWTKNAALPGGDFPHDGFEALQARIAASAPFLSGQQVHRFARSYGTETFTLLGDAKSTADLGQNFGAGLTMREVDYLRQHEWAQTAEDILWRRSKLGLHLSRAQHDVLVDQLR